MAYADYAYYMSVFLGTAIPEEDFPRLAERASEYIDYLTQGRLKTLEIVEPVKKCCCSLAELYAVEEKATAAALSPTGVLKSESVGGWSQSYATSADYASIVESKCLSTARRYLAPTGLLYRGGGRKCPCSPTP